MNWGGLSGITRSSLGLKEPTVNQPKRQAEDSYQLQVWVVNFWRSCKVGLDRWCDKPSQTLWLGSNLQQAKPGAWMLPVFVLYSWCVHEFKERVSDWFVIWHFMNSRNVLNSLNLYNSIRTTGETTAFFFLNLTNVKFLSVLYWNAKMGDNRFSSRWGIMFSDSTVETAGVRWEGLAVS